MNFKSLRVALAILLILPQQLAFAAPNTPFYTISIDSTAFSGPGGLTVDISGTGNANPYAGQISQHDVEVNWGDGTAVDPDSDNYTFADPTPAPDKTNDFTGTWTNTHTYAQPGTYEIKVKLYHKNSPGAEASEDIEIIDVGTGNLTVVKVVNGGTAVVSDFPLFIDQTLVTSGSTTALVPGTYTVSETTNADYVGTFSGDCDATGAVTIAEGDNKTCTLTNDFGPVAGFVVDFGDKTSGLKRNKATEVIFNAVHQN